MRGIDRSTLDGMSTYSEDANGGDFGQMLKIWRVNRRGWEAILVSCEDGKGWGAFLNALYNEEEEEQDQARSQTITQPNAQIRNRVEESNVVEPSILLREKDQNANQWQRVVLVFTTPPVHGWNLVEYMVRAGTKREVKLCPFGPDRALLECVDLNEKELVLKHGKALGGALVAKVESWSLRNHAENSCITYGEGWIRINGLPWNMWNQCVFQTIGDKYGGLLKVSKGTGALDLMKGAWPHDDEVADTDKEKELGRQIATFAAEGDCDNAATETRGGPEHTNRKGRQSLYHQRLVQLANPNRHQYKRYCYHGKGYAWGRG
ncbi:hypothetical protein Scep_026267 [Stephania cephalantha]|uniref:DUF4283 domain-containing protein n=1 Tax=Stephania cephalantha TaxID=152367 RepID=A0AAP0HN12_9MAGN